MEAQGSAAFFSGDYNLSFMCIIILYLCISVLLVHEFDIVFFQICAPIVVDGHISLVVVSHTESKIYFLDSYPDEHKEVADILVTNLQSCLQRHDIDISLYEKVTPEVKAQQNK